MLGGNLQAEVYKLKNPSEKQLEHLKAEWQKRHDAVLASGGLHIVGTERHEPRRIDNQLRSRSGRQGDAGSSRFYLSLDDALMRIFASEKMGNMMKRLGMEKGESIEHPWVSRAIENAQRKVEGRNFDIRKSLLEYDDVANDQRGAIYEQRNELLDDGNIGSMIANIRKDVVSQVINQYIAPQSLDEMWDVNSLEERLKSDFAVDLPVQEWLDDDDKLFEETIRELIYEVIVKAYELKEKTVGADVIRNFEKVVMLQSVDSLWKEHLAAMDHLRQGIHLRGYAQKNPKQEYKRESFELFSQMLDTLKVDVITILSPLQVQQQADVEAVDEQRRAAEVEKKFEHKSVSQSDAQKPVSVKRSGPKVGRNDACLCGSGKKYKQCHGKIS